MRKAETIGVVGRCIGFDISVERVDELRMGYDRTGEMMPQDLKEVSSSRRTRRF